MLPARNIRLYNPKESISYAKLFLEQKGFRLVYGSRNNSRYYQKINYPWRIRVSDHPHRGLSDMCVADIVFSGRTTRADIEYQVRKAIDKFEKKVRSGTY